MSSQRARVAETRAMPPNSANTSIPRIAKSTRPTADNFTTRLPQRTSITSVGSSSGRRSSGSMDSSIRSVQTRSSTLPRSTSANSQTKIPALASSRPAVSTSSKTTYVPSEVSKASTALDASNTFSRDPSFDFAFDTQPCSSANQDVVYATEPSQKRRSRSGFTLPAPAGPLPPRLIPELQALAATSNRSVPPPPSSSLGSIMSSPSTVFTTSPSPWSASTTTTTPVSWSSASPSIVQPTSTSSSGKRSQTVPVPATTRVKLPKLPVLKENQPPSSTSSKTDSKEEPKVLRKKIKKTPLSSPAPTPPPRSSSARSRSNSKSSLQGKMDSDDLPPMPNTTEDSPLAKHGSIDIDRIGQTLEVITKNDGHLRLQAALNLQPTERPRDRAEPDRSAMNEPFNTKVPNDGSEKQLLDAAPLGKRVHRRLTSRDEKLDNVESEKSLPKQSARSRLAKFSKLALFGRSKETPKVEPSPAVVARKGPVAGTGHEGYGRFGRRPRKGSAGSNTGATDSDASTTHVPPRHQRKDSGKSSRRESSSQSELDDFASSRMKPVVLLGGSQKSQPTATEATRQKLKSSNTTYDSHVSRAPKPSVSARASPEVPSPAKTLPEHRPTLAQRRSQKFADASEPFRLPGPIETQNLAAPPCLDSQNTTYSSEVPTSAAYSEHGFDMYRVDPYLLDKQRKKSRRLKWNLFSKKDEFSDTTPVPEVVNRSMQEPEVPVSISAVPTTKPMPYYAMLESESEIMTTETIGEYLDEAAQSPKFSDAGDQDISPEELSPLRQRVDSVLLPSAPERKLYAEYPVQSSEDIQPPFVVQGADSPRDSELDFPLPPQTSPERSDKEQPLPAPEQPKARQPRLLQVGRIPKVVQRSQKVSTAEQPDSNRTGRPLNSGVNKQVAPEPVTKEESRRRLNPKLGSESLRSKVLPPVPEIETDFAPPGTTVFGKTLMQSPANDDFLKFSNLDSSDFTASSSSDGFITIMGPSIATKVPVQQHNRHADHEDDIWNEYDDFIDRVMSPPGIRESDKDLAAATSASYKRALAGKANGNSKGLAIIPPLISQYGPTQPLPTPPYVFTTSPSLKEASSSEEMRLRRSRIAAALHSSYTSFDPSSPFSMREFIAEYGRRDSGKLSERFSNSTTGMLSPETPAFIEQVPVPEVKHYENAAHIDEVERTRNPLKHSELSYASLMVSRALSFGRVLFSPAHADIENQPERHVLVIDGLGNEDWSIYCAVTYQAQKAYVHDLKEKRPTNRGSQASRKSGGNVPSNHRRAEVPSFNDKFPFPPAFFSAVVLRFPPVMAESKLRNIMAECKRILAPGGFLELMVLELDIVNMGVQTRRAVKDLKIKMSTSDREVSLKPIIDNVQSVLGLRGFSNVSRCVVGVPVVGRPVSSTGSTSSSRSSGSPIKRSSAGPRPFDSLNLQDGFSLNDLVADHSENADAKIGRMVSRTARSWWQHCFEASVISDGNLAKSIFANKEIMTECKTRASNFKLLIAYTQKPGVDQRRRTLSEPTIPALATAGITRTIKTAK